MNVEKIQEIKYQLISSIVSFEIVCLPDKLEEIVDEEEDVEDWVSNEGDNIGELVSEFTKAVDELINGNLKANAFVEKMNDMNKKRAFIETLERDRLCEIIELAGGDLKEVENLREW